MSGLPPVPVARKTFASQQEFEASAGRPSQQPRNAPTVITVTGSDAYRIRPLTERLAIRFGVSVELLGRDQRTANVFVCHPDDVAFDSMELSLSGFQGTVDKNQIPWVAQAQLIQKKDDRQWKISGAINGEDETINREPTVIPLESRDSVFEYRGGFIEKAWGLFLNLEIIRLVGDSALPAWAADIRFQVTVNLVSAA